MDVHTKKCEACGLKQPSFGLPGEGKKRWCGGCAKAHAGAELKTGYNKMCESCVLKKAHYGLPMEGTRRWCMACAQPHAGLGGAINIKTKRPVLPVGQRKKREAKQEPRKKPVGRKKAVGRKKPVGRKKATA